jgi:hypothetical protein
MRAMRFNGSAFVKEYMEARSAGLTSSEFAELLGVSVGVVHGRKHRLLKRGIVLPPLKGQCRVAAKPMLRLAAPVECQVLPADLHFVIHVGG